MHPEQLKISFVNRALSPNDDTPLKIGMLNHDTLIYSVKVPAQAQLPPPPSAPSTPSAPSAKVVSPPPPSSTPSSVSTPKIDISVLGSDGQHIYFKLSMDTKFEKMISIYREKVQYYTCIVLLLFRYGCHLSFFGPICFL